MRKTIVLIGLLALIAAPAGAQTELFVGTGAFSGSVANDSFLFTDLTPPGTSMSVLTGVPLWGAAYNAATDEIWFTTSGTANADGSDIFAVPPSGGTPTLVGTITSPTGAQMRTDGLAFVGGTLYGVHQFDDAAASAGVYEIDLMTFSGTLVASLATGDVSGIGGDQSTGLLYGVADTQGALIEIDPGTGMTSVVTGYPVGKTDIDGLAVCDGLAYLVPDDGTPGEIFVYDIGAGSYQTSLTSPLVNTDTFSAGACTAVAAPMIPVQEIPTLSQWGMLLIGLLLTAAAVWSLRRRQRTA